MKFLNRIKFNLKLFWHSLFFGLKGADDTIRRQVSGTDGVGVDKKINPGGVFSDMLEEKVTKEVEEMRDKHYRVLREADLYKPNITMVSAGKGEDFEFKLGGATKKTKEDFMRRPPVYEKDGTKVFTIQDNKKFERATSINSYYIPNGLYDYDTTILIKRDFTPRFEIEKFVSRVVVRISENKERAFVDLYLPTMASQFGKIDAIFISNLYQLYESEDRRSDIIDFQEISWVSEKAWNCQDMCRFKFDDIKLSDINIFDGSFVFSFDCHIVELANDLTEKYKTKELDEKYETMAPKGNATDLFAIKRKNEKKEKREIDLNNLENTDFKI